MPDASTTETTPTIAEIASIDNLKKAMRFVRQDKEDEYVACPLRDLPYTWQLEANLRSLKRLLLTGNYHPQRSTIVEVVKSSFATRPVSHIGLEDWLVAQAILNKVGPLLDSLIPENSYAFRLNPKRNDGSRHKFFKAWYRDWPKFIQTLRKRIGTQFPCLLITDIAGYFENIDLQRLKQMVLEAGVRMEVADLMLLQLEQWTWRHRYDITHGRGLLQGNDVSSLYANFYLQGLDQHYQAEGVSWLRFMDDINIHCASKAEAKMRLADLNRRLRAQGLCLNTAKTYILEGEEIEEHFLFDVSDRIKALLEDQKAGGDTPRVRSERAAILRVLKRKKRVNSHLFRRLVTSYKRARDPRLLHQAMGYLESYPDLTPKLCEYFSSLRNATHVATLLLAFLSDAQRNLFASQEQEIVRCLLDIDIDAKSVRSDTLTVAMGRIREKNTDYYSKSLYALLVYKYGDAPLLEELSDRFLAVQALDHVLARHLALASTRLNDPGLLDRVIDKLKRDPRPELTDLGVFLDEARKIRSITALLNHVTLRTQQFGTESRVIMDVRDLILLNILRWNRETKNQRLLRTHVQRYENQLSSRRTRELLAEILLRL